MTSAADVRIRPARLADAAGILALEALFPTDRMSMRSVRRFLRAPGAHVLVAERETQTLGNLVLLFRKGAGLSRIYSVVVGPDARGLGIGARLVEAAEAEARRRRSTGITLEVRADNAAARALYARLGYVEERVLPAFYEDGADGLRLTRKFGVPDQVRPPR